MQDTTQIALPALTILKSLENSVIGCSSLAIAYNLPRWNIEIGHQLCNAVNRFKSFLGKIGLTPHAPTLMAIIQPTRLRATTGGSGVACTSVDGRDCESHVEPTHGSHDAELLADRIADRMPVPPVPPTL